MGASLQCHRSACLESTKEDACGWGGALDRDIEAARIQIARRGIMKSGNDSITRRLILSVLVLELLAGLTLVGAVAVNERRVQYKALDANLRASSNVLLGAIQEDINNAVRLDLTDKTLPKDSVLRVTDEHGLLLGSEGVLPAVAFQPDTFQH